MSRRPGPPRREAVGPARLLRPLDDEEIAGLAAALDELPAPLEPLSVSALDGFLCGVLVQPGGVARVRWLPLIFDEQGRPAPPGIDLSAPLAWIDRRAAELRSAIERRAWFDPWIFADAATPADDVHAAVAPWVIGLAAALDAFPDLLDDEGPELDEALAPAFRFLDRADLEDADGLFEAIDMLGPAADLEAAVEGLVRSTLLLADVAGLPELKPPR